MGLSIGMVTVDCADPAALSGFWSAALDTTVAADYGEFIMLAPPPRGGPLLAFQRVPEPRTGKNRLHLDLGAPAGGRHTEVERLVQLGATMLGERATRRSSPGPPSPTRRATSSAWRRTRALLIQ